MKKSLLILSAAAMAFGAMAYDQPVAGTAETPNYYLIKANRGDFRFLGYSAEGIEAPNGTTNLVRTDDVTLANVWAVTAGTEEGTIVVKNCAADAYLQRFFNANGETVALMATAGTATAPVDIYPVSCNGAWALNINGETCPENEYYSLDAPGGTAQYCGNYIPTDPANGEGTCWWFSKVTPAAGQSVEQAAQAIYVSEVIKPSIDGINIYKAAVPEVASELDEGIARLQALTYSTDIFEKINTIVTETYAAANLKLTSCFDDRVIAIKNVRRAETGMSPYMCVDGETYKGAVTIADPAAQFVFKKASGAESGYYTVYNEETQSYIGTDYTPVSAPEAAIHVTPMLYTSGGYTGLALITIGDNRGFNWQSWENGEIANWDINDPGSIWTLVPADKDDIVADAAASVAKALSPYAANSLPAVRTILENAIEQANGLTYSADLAEKAAAIVTKAIDDSNNYMATELNGKTFGLYHVRSANYLAVRAEGETNFFHTDACTGEDALFVFTAAGQGGYKLFNDATGTYVGPRKDTDDNALTLVADADAAVVVYPVICTAGNFSGVALAFATEGENIQGVNMNGFDNLWEWYITDEGSIWKIADPADTGIDAIVAAPAARGIYDLQGRRLAAPVKGICIINGKKVLVK